MGNFFLKKLLKKGLKIFIDNHDNNYATLLLIYVGLKINGKNKVPFNMNIFKFLKT